LGFVELKLPRHKFDHSIRVAMATHTISVVAEMFRGAGAHCSQKQRYRNG
jgi:hypothetical protein